MTDKLKRRIYEYKLGLVEGFTKKYNVNRLVYYESQPDLKSAVKREKQLKNWRRQQTINLIESMNKEWKDLYTEISNTIELLYSTNIEDAETSLPCGGQVQHR